MTKGQRGACTEGQRGACTSDRWVISHGEGQRGVHGALVEIQARASDRGVISLPEGPRDARR